ncbi:MAG: hydroxyacylglutathione hydrolase [Chitinispirillaceae bacterium]|nr:hydroxyacylglutathione hydrolase [Chitinispirillaceae bacterium]
MDLDIVTLPVGGDNYTYCCIAGNEAAIVDAAEAQPVVALLEKRRLSLRLILSTHHHGDHTGGNARLKKMTSCNVIGGDRRISGIDRIVNDHERVVDGPFSFECIAVPGHTRGCFVFYFGEQAALFTGDTLFYAGCGRLFEGTAGELHHSLKKISLLPPTMHLYCGHEYTLENLKFARSVEPDNAAIVERAVAAGLQLQKQNFSGPSTLAQELATNPFLRTGETTIRRNLGLPDATDGVVFGELRRRKDHF